MARVLHTLAMVTGPDRTKLASTCKSSERTGSKPRAAGGPHITVRSSLEKVRAYTEASRAEMEKSKANHSSIPAWETPWTEEPGGISQFHGIPRVGHDLASKPLSGDPEDSLGGICVYKLTYTWASQIQVARTVSTQELIFHRPRQRGKHS